MAVANGTEAIDHLTQEISALPPDQVVGELGSFLEGTYLEDMVASEGIGQTLTLMRVTEHAIGYVSDPEARTPLCKDAVDSLVNLMQDASFKPDSFESARALVEQAERYAELTENPAEKAFRFSNIAEGVVYLPANEYKGHRPFEWWWRSTAYMNKAVESAQGIETAGYRAHTLRLLAETPAALIVKFSESHGSNGDLVLAARLSRQQVKTYEKALEAADAIPEAHGSLIERGRVAYSMTRKAATLSEANPELSERLAAMSLSEIDQQLSACGPGAEGASLPAAQKANYLARLGSGLSDTIDSQYGSPERNSTLRQQLIERMVRAYKATRVYAKEVAASPDEQESGYYADFSTNARIAATNLVNSDFDAAKELFEIGFDLASLKDSTDGLGLDRAHGITTTIRHYAEKQKTVRPAFELYSMAYRLERRRLPEGQQTSDEMRRTAYQCLKHLSRAPREDFVALEEIDREFIEFSISDDAITEPNVPLMVKPVSNLVYRIGDLELMQKVSERAESLRTKAEEAKRPTNRLARIAYEKWARD